MYRRKIVKNNHVRRSHNFSNVNIYIVFLNNTFTIAHVTRTQCQLKLNSKLLVKFICLVRAFI